VRISFASLPGFPRLRVAGHAGQLIIGLLGKTPVLVLSGRAHYYEGYSMREVTFHVQVLAACGVTHLLLTNAAGAINTAFRPGHLMVIQDHISLMPENPLRGIEGPSRFLDLTRTYDAEMSALLTKAGRLVGLNLKSGVYLAVPGPCYETPAEIRAFARLGADAIGMSTVPEAIVARHCGLAVAGLSCISNMAAGLGQRPVSHAEVLATGEQVSDQIRGLIMQFAQLFAARAGQS
jgi:purine-nucleoside phosphorylase